MIWSLEDDEGNVFEDEGPLKDLGKSFFEHIFRDESLTCLESQVKVISLFPRMIHSEHSLSLTS